MTRSNGAARRPPVRTVKPADPPASAGRGADSEGDDGVELMADAADTLVGMGWRCLCALCNFVGVTLAWLGGLLGFGREPAGETAAPRDPPAATRRRTKT